MELHWRSLTWRVVTVSHLEGHKSHFPGVFATCVPGFGTQRSLGEDVDAAGRHHPGAEDLESLKHPGDFLIGNARHPGNLVGVGAEPAPDLGNQDGQLLLVQILYATLMKQGLA